MGHLKNLFLKRSDETDEMSLYVCISVNLTRHFLSTSAWTLDIVVANNSTL